MEKREIISHQFFFFFREINYLVKNITFTKFSSKKYETISRFTTLCLFIKLTGRENLIFISFSSIWRKFRCVDLRVLIKHFHFSFTENNDFERKLQLFVLFEILELFEYLLRKYSIFKLLSIPTRIGKNISWNQLFSNFFTKTIDFTKFLQKCVRLNRSNFHTVTLWST